jgi:hypothetical protein
MKLLMHSDSAKAPFHGIWMNKETQEQMFLQRKVVPLEELL